MVSRMLDRLYEEGQGEATVVTASSGSVKVYTEPVTTRAEYGTEFNECLLRSHSAHRDSKERANTGRFKKRFEKALDELHDGLSKKGTHKKLVAVNQRIERL